MAVDESLLQEAVEKQTRVPVIRFYRWDPPALSIGRNQTLPSSVATAAHDAGLRIVRRPSGGGAVIHSGDLTYSAIVPEKDGVVGTYRFIAKGLIEGLRRLGIEAKVVQHPTRPNPLSCFAIPTGADLETQGKKICGSAQTRRAGWVLQHGSIPIGDIEALAGSVFGSDVSSEPWTCLIKLNQEITVEVLKASLTQGFSSLFGGPPSVRGLDKQERKRAERLMHQGALADPLAVL